MLLQICARARGIKSTLADQAKPQPVPFHAREMPAALDGGAGLLNGNYQHVPGASRSRISALRALAAK